MKRTLLTLAGAILLWTLLPTNMRAFSTVTVCASGCTTTSLQTALNSLAACGDTVQIKSTETQTGNYTITYRGCTALTPIKVTSDRCSTWVPNANARVTPSHMANMAQIVTTGTSPALQGMLDGSSRPPAHWVFTCIAFKTTGFTYQLVSFNGNAEAVNSSQIADDITFDRDYFGQPQIYNGEALQNIMRGDATNLVVKNCFLGDAFMNGAESHGIGVLTNPGPVTLTNNYITAAAIPIFIGGFTPSYPVYMPNGLTAQYNYSYRPWKYLNDAAQPYYADYTTAQSQAGGAYIVCTKNLGEFKYGVGLTWQYNVGENSWYANNCGSQFLGFTNTLRTEPETITTFSMTDTTHLTWTGSYRIAGSGSSYTTALDMGLCMVFSTGTECRAIASFSGASLIVVSAFSSAPGGTLTGIFNYNGSAQLKNVTISHNVWKNVDQTMSVLAIAPSNGTGDDGFGKTHVISQNLWYSNISYVGPNARGFLLTPGEYSYGFNAPSYTFDHNTFYYPAGMGGGYFVYLSSDQSAIQPKFTSAAITNNLFGTSFNAGVGAFAGDAANDTIGTTNMYFVSSNVKNNALPGGMQTGTATSGNVVSGNIYATWSDPFGGLAPNNFTVQPSSAYYHAATDGTSLGADPTQLPMIYNVAVNLNVLNFDLTSGINSDVKNTQPCVLEVSSNRNLSSDLGTYSVIASLDPTVTIGADLSTRADVILSGTHVSWPLTGVTPGTTYYLRLQCYGDMEQFSFTAVSSQTGSIVPGKSLVPGKALVP